MVQLAQVVTQRNKRIAYYIACLQISPRKQFADAAMLNTNDENQKALTTSERTVPVLEDDSCKVEAVTAEKNVVAVAKFNRWATDCC